VKVKEKLAKVALARQQATVKPFASLSPLSAE
jgi:hypothetical protein